MFYIMFYYCKLFFIIVGGFCLYIFKWEVFSWSLMFVRIVLYEDVFGKKEVWLKVNDI